MASIYVGTYAKYNNGSLSGKWLDPEDYADKDEFIAACLELHEDEDDPELMFQDREDIPDNLIDESSVSEDLWNFLELDADDRIKVEDVWGTYDPDLGVQESHDLATESYQGEFESPEDFAQFTVDEGFWGDVPDRLQWYLDFSAIARDLDMDYTFVKCDEGIRVYRFY